MRIAPLFAACVLILPTILHGLPFSFGRHSFEIPTPQGFVLLEETEPMAAEIFALVSDPRNKVIAVYLTEADLNAMRNGSLPSLSNYCSIVYRTDFSDLSLTPENFELFKNMLRSILANPPAEMVSEVNKLMADIPDLGELTRERSKMRFSELEWFPPHAEGDQFISFSLISHAETTELGLQPKDELSTGSSIMIGDTIVDLAVTSTDNELEHNRDIAHQWTLALIEANSETKAAAAPSSGGKGEMSTRDK